MQEMARTENNNRRRARPRACPECGSKNLQNLSGEYFCNECDWDGVDIYARICVLDNPWEHSRGQDEFKE